MQRIVDSGFRETIGTALSRLPPNIARRLRHVDFFCGVPPLFAGLARGEAYTFPAVCFYPDYTPDQTTTIYLPKEYHEMYQGEEVGVVLHELGHALAYPMYDLLPESIFTVSEYAKTNYREAFAEAFRVWLFPESPREIESMSYNVELKAILENLP